ncbi:glycosyltransferase family 4 protein [Anaerosoma tenue]|uniref:glycosyltransferase family 4 protein n=1 Tax=Anaerosoma tenue TaxID=2933588 RepID=UPI002260A485|nr:glycosyltransferase family 4 protein [Anaerosoma tenue]MCK8114683.1 glycosyltransferase family 4 protein [Anaerosoma tenue]
MAHPHATGTDASLLEGVRILYLNVFGGPTVGGGEVVLLRMIEAARAAGAETTLVCLPDAEVGRRAAAAGSSVVYYDLLPPGVLTRLPALRRLVRDARPDIVQGSGMLTNLLVRMIAPCTAAVVNTVQVLPDAARSDGRVLGAWARAVAGRVARGRTDRFIAVSDAVKRGLVEAGVPTERIRTIYPAVDVDALIASAREQPPAGLPEGHPLVGMLGRLEPVKGTGSFIAAAARVHEFVPEAALVVAGDGSERSRLEHLAAEADVTLIGDVSCAPGFLNALDVVVVPSLSEAFGLVAAEASALGKPVVATNTGGLPEVVEDGVSGLLVPPRDPAGLADAIVRLLEDPAMRARMGEAGQRIVRERFGLERMADELVAVYRDVAGRA